MAKVTVNSVLIAADELKQSTVDAIRNACTKSALRKAVELWGPAQRLTVRDIDGGDMQYPNSIFAETAVTANAWNAMACGAFTVATATVIGIYGIKLYTLYDATTLCLPITGIRIDVGGARVAQWNVQTLDQTDFTASVAPNRGRLGVTKSPIVVGEDITVTIYEYTRTTNRTYTPVWMGCVVEKEGRTLKP